MSDILRVSQIRLNYRYHRFVAQESPDSGSPEFDCHHNRCAAFHEPIGDPVCVCASPKTPCQARLLPPIYLSFAAIRSYFSERGGCRGRLLWSHAEEEPHYAEVSGEKFVEQEHQGERYNGNNQEVGENSHIRGNYEPTDAYPSRGGGDHNLMGLAFGVKKMASACFDTVVRKT